MKLNVGCSFVSQEIREIPFFSWVENSVQVLERNNLLSCTKVGTGDTGSWDSTLVLGLVLLLQKV